MTRNNQLTSSILNEVFGYYNDKKNYLNEEDYTILGDQSTYSDNTNINDQIMDMLKTGTYTVNDNNEIVVPVGNDQNKDHCITINPHGEAFDNNTQQDVQVSPEIVSKVKEILGSDSDSAKMMDNITRQTTGSNFIAEALRKNQLELKVVSEAVSRHLNEDKVNDPLEYLEELNRYIAEEPTFQRMLHEHTAQIEESLAAFLVNNGIDIDTLSQFEEIYNLIDLTNLANEINKYKQAIEELERQDRANWFRAQGEEAMTDYGFDYDQSDNPEELAQDPQEQSRLAFESIVRQLEEGYRFERFKS